MTWCFSFKKKKFATLRMTQQYIHVHQILKRLLWNYLMTGIWFLIGLESIAWWKTPENFRLCFLGQTLIIANLHLWQKISKNRVKSRNEVKLLGVTIDDKLSFTIHIENLSSTASNHLRALAKIRKFISFEQEKRLSEAYIMSTFTYSPLIWINCSKTASNLTNKIHMHSLRVIYEMEDANFEDLLIKDSSWTIHENNFHTLLIEIYKS